MFLFAVSILLSAFLLFQIQPMIGKIILPWFGGTPAVWSTAMLFFQVLLTGGYTYAYWLIGRVTPRRQFAVHLSLVAAAVLLLAILSLVWPSPITPASSWKPQDVSSPILEIFRLLMVSVGLPYFLLASNGPLMQAWFSRLFPQRSYAQLYALSNLGSLFGLLAYPLLIEPALTLRWQGWIWGAGFVLFGLLAGWSAARSREAGMLAQPSAPHRPRGIRRAEPQADPILLKNHPSLALSTLWLALSATASLFLLSVTNQITQEVAVIPFLWVLPLALYLLSFMLAFSGEHGYPRRFYATLFILSAGLTLFVMLSSTSLHVYCQVLAYCTLLFAACMLCHGELYLLRPASEYLTTFYLMVSIGGAAGGIFVSLIAPLIFNGYWEFFVGLAMALAIFVMMFRSPNAEPVARARFICFIFLSVTVTLSIVGVSFSGALYAKRNFYGVVRVRELVPAGSSHRAYVLSHGITVHGLEFIDPELRLTPTTYYVPESGAALAIVNQPRYGRGQRVGLLGVGLGTLAAYAQPGDIYRLYEINPVVISLAEGQGGYFSFVRESKADVSMIRGDARISLERELAVTGSQNFDVMVLDTFSSDSIPVHLVTEEAFALYLDHLAPQGIIAAHISNRHLDLQPVFWQLARYYHLSMARIDYPGDSAGGYSSSWILLARDPALLAVPAVQQRAVDLNGYSTDVKLWTDDYSNFFQLLK